MVDSDFRLKREILVISGILALGSLFVTFPFLDAIILGAAASYFLRYAQKRLDVYIDNSQISSMIVVSAIVGIIFFSLFGFVSNFETITLSAVSLAQDYQEGSKAFIDQLEISDEVKNNLKQQVDSFFQPSQVQNLFTDILASLPMIIVDLGIFLVVAIYLFKDEKKLRSEFYSAVEKLPRNEEKIARTLIRSIDSIFRGVFITQFIVTFLIILITFIGFQIIGFVTTPIPFTLTWSIIIGIAAFLPIIAAFMIYGPMGFYFLFFGEPIKGTLILGFGLIFLNIIPAIFLRPYVGSKQMDEHPLIIFLGFLAGPLTLGLKGIIVGPIVLILAKDFILNYSDIVSSEPESHISDR